LHEKRDEKKRGNKKKVCCALTSFPFTRVPVFESNTSSLSIAGTEAGSATSMQQSHTGLRLFCTTSVRSFSTAGAVGVLIFA